MEGDTRVVYLASASAIDSNELTATGASMLRKDIAAFWARASEIKVEREGERSEASLLRA